MSPSAPTAPRRVAIYTCVEKREIDRMDLGRELMDLRAWCGQNHHQVVAQYVDDDRDGSGRRPERARLMKDAARQQFDMVLVWSLDRFDVKGVGETALDIRRLLRDGVAFHSFTEDHLSTDDPQMQPVLLPVILSFAGLEEKKVSKRIKAGMRRAHAKGKRFGRPGFSVEQRMKLQTALNTGANWLKVSRGTGIPYSTVKKYARQLGYEPPGWVPY
jgi:DNA invertase Pin-like site-specific DNA recombinase